MSDPNEVAGKTPEVDFGTADEVIAGLDWINAHNAALKPAPRDYMCPRCQRFVPENAACSYCQPPATEPAPQYRRTEKCDRLRHSMGYMLCPGCEPVPAEPTGTSEPEEDAPDKLKRKIKTLEGNLRDLNTLYFKSLDNYNSMEDWWHKEWHQSQGIPCANDEYCPLTRRVNLPALLSTPSAPATKPAEPGIIGVRGVIEACFPQTDEDTVFERESAIAFIKAIHDRELAKVCANALEAAAQVANQYFRHLSTNGVSCLEYGVAQDIESDIRALDPEKILGREGKGE